MIGDRAAGVNEATACEEPGLVACGINPWLSESLVAVPGRPRRLSKKLRSALAWPAELTCRPYT